MKAEKINKNQIRFTLNKADLQARHLKIADLSYGSDKTKALFDDMMHQALIEFGFEVCSEKPLMIEAVPTSEDSLTVTVTQINSREDAMALFQPRTTEGLPDAAEPPQKPEDAAAADDARTDPATDKQVYSLLYTFSSFEDVLSAAKLVPPTLRLRNELYRSDDGMYHILLHYSRLSGPTRYVMTFLTEYAKSVSSDALWISFIQEHGRLSVRSRALQRLSQIEQEA